ncbi:hypothetical protein FN846DRAFT_890988 [Sphaerosporella brunnea]|uniref:Uncharacterized protein n=1 Tax=Sphaerosporella brunnea TaxID=1250544 RepID=A0A5J5EUP3_9PEZI|nr:hypothetical protein FN846DRAFT_890988 [Sphaerosporella brunnea]
MEWGFAPTVKLASNPFCTPEVADLAETTRTILPPASPARLSYLRSSALNQKHHSQPGWLLRPEHQDSSPPFLNIQTWNNVTKQYDCSIPPPPDAARKSRRARRTANRRARLNAAEEEEVLRELLAWNANTANSSSDPAWAEIADELEARAAAEEEDSGDGLTTPVKMVMACYIIFQRMLCTGLSGASARVKSIEMPRGKVLVDEWYMDEAAEEDFNFG